MAEVDKFDASREFPYTIRVQETGYRGRVLPEEVEPLSGPPIDKRVATLKANDHFGENALLKGVPRAATIEAATDLVVFKLTREKFKAYELSSKLQFAKRKAVAAPSPEVDFDLKQMLRPGAQELIPKTPQESALIKSAIKTNSNL